jgi:hypothetical protein
MQPFTFCTIITPDFLHYALALRESLLEYDSNIRLYILLSDVKEELKETVESKYSDTYILFAKDLCEQGTAKAIWDKYYTTYTDGFRWSMKPILLQHLLLKSDKVVYVDCDIHFYNSYQFLFEELNSNNLLITPHWRSSDPFADEFNFNLLYTSGLYNGGFVGAKNKAIDALEWWAKANLFACEINQAQGRFVDQTHLNLLPIYFENIKVLHHRGCNVAGWNLIECKRTLHSDGQILINNTWPIVFVHYSEATLYFIRSGTDYLLQPYFETYQKRINNYGEKFRLSPLVLDHPKTIVEIRQEQSMFLRIKNKVKSILNQLICL